MPWIMLAWTLFSTLPALKLYPSLIRLEERMVDLFEISILYATNAAIVVVVVVSIGAINVFVTVIVLISLI